MTLFRPHQISDRFWDEVPGAEAECFGFLLAKREFCKRNGKVGEVLCRFGFTGYRQLIRTYGNLTSFELTRRETNTVRASCSQETVSVRSRQMDCSVGESRLPSLVHDDHVINDKVIDVAAAPAIVTARFDV